MAYLTLKEHIVSSKKIISDGKNVGLMTTSDFLTIHTNVEPEILSNGDMVFQIETYLVVFYKCKKTKIPNTYKAKVDTSRLADVSLGYYGSIVRC